MFCFGGIDLVMINTCFVVETLRWVRSSKQGLQSKKRVQRTKTLEWMEGRGIYRNGERRSIRSIEGLRGQVKRKANFKNSEMINKL